MDRAATLIQKLGLQPHPERGFFAETYRSPQRIDSQLHGGTRAASTAIYFLINAEHGATYLHRLISDEIFHFYEGGPLDVLMLFADGRGEVRRLGTNIEAGERPQIVIPAGTWFGTALPAGVSHCLFGCTVAPGFEFEDFALAQGPELAVRYPSFAGLIARMSRHG
ncbi:MAG: cupin domain-containing protein [Deltaproteobacteria bacterium]|nr:cupin domain-containing protein [Deltaproteobacteria bacterium]